jgi:hypothetical protein
LLLFKTNAPEDERHQQDNGSLTFISGGFHVSFGAGPRLISFSRVYQQSSSNMARNWSLPLLMPASTFSFDRGSHHDVRPIFAGPSHNTTKVRLQLAVEGSELISHPIQRLSISECSHFTHFMIVKKGWLSMEKLSYGKLSRQSLSSCDHLLAKFFLQQVRGHKEAKRA